MRTDKNLNRDEEQKPGTPPRSASEPRGSEGSSRNPKTFTDPASGAQDKPGGHAPNQSEADDLPN